MKKFLKLTYCLSFTFTLMLLHNYRVAAQDSTSTEGEASADTSDYLHFYTEEEDVLEMEKEDEEEIHEFKKEGIIHKIIDFFDGKHYYDKKIKKGFTQSGYGRRLTIEIFYYLKANETPSKYAQNIAYYDFHKGAIKTLPPSRYDKEEGQLLHGPYKKMVNDVVVEEGYYYMGQKHGRWEKYKQPKEKEYNGEEIEEKLLDEKEKYSFGWPRNADVVYYDGSNEKIKEVIPYDLREKQTGKYYKYFKNGQVEIEGQYINGHKVGEWTEYRMTGGHHYRKKVTGYPEDPDKDAEGKLLREWNEKGRKIFDVEEGGEIKKEETEKKKNKVHSYDNFGK